VRSRSIFGSPGSFSSKRVQIVFHLSNVCVCVTANSIIIIISFSISFPLWIGSGCVAGLSLVPLSLVGGKCFARDL